MDEVEEGLSNLHDAFLSAHLMYQCMINVPVEKEKALLRSLLLDRRRFERLWVAFLAVMVEAWQAAKMRPVMEWIRSVTGATELVDLLKEAGESGHLAKIKKCRHYMFHRGWRKYWDDGRLAPVDEFEFNERLYMAFSGVLREAIDAVNAAKRGNRDLKTRRLRGSNTGLCGSVPPSR
jgi:hypothetical protein